MRRWWAVPLIVSVVALALVFLVRGTIGVHQATPRTGTDDRSNQDLGASPSNKKREACSIRVVDAALKTPIHGALIRIARGELSASRASDSDGLVHFDVPSGAYSIFVSFREGPDGDEAAGNLEVRDALLSAQPLTVEMDVRYSWIISGTVKDVKGGSVEGSVVLSEASSQRVVDAVPISQGTFEKRAWLYPKRKYNLAPQMNLFESDRYVFSVEDVRQPRSVKHDFVVKKVEYYQVAGTVRDPTGKALAGAIVQLVIHRKGALSDGSKFQSKWTSIAETDSEGRFRVQSPKDGDAEVIVTHAKFVSLTFTLGPAVPGDEKALDARFESEKALRTFEATVVDTSAHPLAGVKVTLIRVKGGDPSLPVFADAESDREGNFSFSIDEGAEYKIKMRKPGFAGKTVPLDPAARPTYVLDPE